jgi:hypothetical protein
MHPDDVVLVALISSQRDLELAEQERWYRIPARHAPRHFSGAQYLAFYLPGSFGPRKWSIDTFAAVRGHELARRRDLLPEEPAHSRADELYYKLQLGPSFRREPPIRSKRGRRVLFLWTNWSKFTNAREWNDLYLRSSAHDKLWDALQQDNLDVEREVTIRDGRARYRVDFLLYLPKGRLAIRLGDPPQLRRVGHDQVTMTVAPDQITDQFPQVQEAIQRAAREL